MDKEDIKRQKKSEANRRYREKKKYIPKQDSETDTEDKLLYEEVRNLNDEDFDKLGYIKKEPSTVNTILNNCNLPQELREQINKDIKPKKEPLTINTNIQSLSESERENERLDFLNGSRMLRKKKQPKKKEVALDKYPLEDVDELTIEEFDKIIECEVRKRMREIERTTTIKQDDKPKEPFFFPEKVKSSMLAMITPLIVPFILQIGSRFLQDFATKSTQKASNQPLISQTISQPSAQIDIENHLAKFGMSSKPLS